jgi:rare lipoprotein A (peptidoglycan hydrolase)
MANKFSLSLPGFLVSGFSQSYPRLIQICLGMLLFQSCALLQPQSEPAVPDETPAQPAASKPSISSQPAPSRLVPAQPTAKTTPTAPVTLPQTGQASWYGVGHQGKLTASGTLFDQAELTAAHPSLPFGSKVKVTNLANGKSVEVVITDRGPSSGDRIIDLSQAAAKALEMIDAGTANVRLELP